MRISFYPLQLGVVVVFLSMRQVVGGSIPHRDTSSSKAQLLYIIYNVSYLVIAMLTYRNGVMLFRIDLNTTKLISSAALG